MTLEQYLTDRKIKPSVFAAEIGVAASTITRVMSGERSPGLELLTLIRDKTGGAVTPNDFLPPLTPEKLDQFLVERGLRITDATPTPEQPSQVEDAA